MAEKDPPSKGVTADWLVQGVLTKLGDMFDRLTGRGWKPSSTLATSELIEKMKALLDSEARDDATGRKFVPNNIKLKMQWDKFAADSDGGLKKLETEMLAAAVDHINDKRYFTHAPLSIEAKPDYFTSGVRLLVSFDKFEDEDKEAGVHLSVPGSTADKIDDSVAPHRMESSFSAIFTTGGERKERSLTLRKGSRLSVGRTKENDIGLNDPSVSKIHASLAVDDNGTLLVADTGSTNGTFVNGERIAYGKAVPLDESSEVRFGGVEVKFKPHQIPKPADLPVVPTEPAPIDDFQQTTRIDDLTMSEEDIPVDAKPAATQPAIDIAGAKEGESA
jgi:pSer/pThr/pTyr-binding forkhead associated (FHA) protein